MWHKGEEGSIVSEDHNLGIHPCNEDHEGYYGGHLICEGVAGETADVIVACGNVVLSLNPGNPLAAAKALLEIIMAAREARLLLADEKREGRVTWEQELRFRLDAAFTAAEAPPQELKQ